jgi:magnesium-transporting ATPase (P-type)
MQGSVSEILLNSLDILTFVVPPILPAALTANNAFAQRRLQAGGQHCLLILSVLKGTTS